MSLFSRNTGPKEPLIDIIKFDPPLKGGKPAPWVIYKYPGEKFVLGSQLIVGEGQKALFVKGGKALDLFEPGTHTLHTGNLPLLNKLVNLPFGGETPFTAEIYYINTTSRLDMNWGTQNAFPLEDPKYGLLLHIQAYGTYGIRINDCRAFITELMGAMAGGSLITYEAVAGYFSGLLASRVKNVISDYMIRAKISFLEVTNYLTDISRDCETALKHEFDRFGAQLVNFYCSSIKPIKGEEDKLQEYKAELSMGSDFYTTKRSLDILEKMADNNAGGMAQMGAGMGMGMAFAGQAGELFRNLGGAMNLNPGGGNVNQYPGGGSANQYPGGINSVNGAAAASSDNLCPHCNAPNPPGRKFCGECGQPLTVGIICPRCGEINSVGQKFCGSCGQKLSKVCPGCGKENDPGQKFCGDCGTPL